MKDYQQRMPDIQEIRDSRSDLSVNRSRTQLTFQNGDGGDMQSDKRPSNSRNYMDMQTFSSSSPQTPRSQIGNMSGRSYQGHLQEEVTPTSSKDSGNSSYHDRTIGESPVNVRSSPLSNFQERRNSRNSPFDFNHDPRRTFDRYDHTFHEPPTVDIPQRYEDIAMFKSTEPHSQVSSSTDSGYGHNLIEKMLESQRFSGLYQLLAASDMASAGFITNGHFGLM